MQIDLPTNPEKSKGVQAKTPDILFKEANNYYIKIMILMEQQLGNQGLHALAHWQSKVPKKAQKSQKELKRTQKTPKEPKRVQKSPKEPS